MATEEEQIKAIAEGRIIEHEGPQLYATALRLAADSNEVSIIFQAPRHMQVEHPPGAVFDVARLVTVAVVSMSPQTAKDLHLILQDAVLKYEKDFGEITTAFSRRRSEAATA